MNFHFCDNPSFDRDHRAAPLHRHFPIRNRLSTFVRRSRTSLVRSASIMVISVRQIDCHRIESTLQSQVADVIIALLRELSYVSNQSDVTTPTCTQSLLTTSARSFSPSYLSSRTFNRFLRPLLLISGAGLKVQQGQRFSEYPHAD